MRQIIEIATVAPHLLADAHQAVHTLGLQQLTHADVQFVAAIALGGEVAQDDRAGPVARTARHEIERGREGIIVAGIAINNHRAVVHTLDDVQPCAHGREGRHALGDGVAIQPQMQQHRQTGDGIVDIAVGDKGNHHLAVLVIKRVVQCSGILGAVGTVHLQGRLTVVARPGYGQRHIALDKRGNGVGHQRVIGAIDDALAAVQDLGFFLSLLLHGFKSVIVLAAQVGDDAYGGTDHRMQIIHLVDGRNACLDNRQVGIVVDVPQRQGHTDLGIVAAGRPHDAVIVLEQLVQPLLDSGLATAARDADDRQLAETTAMKCRQCLQGVERRFHGNEVGSGALGGSEIIAGNDKITHALVIQVGDVIVSIICLGAQGKEYRLFGLGERTRVGQQLAHDGILVDDVPAGHFQHIGYFGD